MYIYNNVEVFYNEIKNTITYRSNEIPLDNMCTLKSHLNDINLILILSLVIFSSLTSY